MAYSPLQLKTFQDIYTAVLEEIKGGSVDTNQIARVKRNINIVYNEIVDYSRWSWLNGHITIPVQAAISAGTVAVTQNSSTLTFSTAPTGSKAGYYFSTEGSSEIYLIESHTSGSTTALLSDVWVAATSATSSYKLWTDRIALPVGCKETINVYSDARSTPLDNVGLQEFRRYTVGSPKAEGKPMAYYTGDFIDPSQTSTISSLPALSTRASSGLLKTLVFASALPSTVCAGVSLRISKAGDPGYNGDIIVSSIGTTSTANDTLTYTGRATYQESAASDSSLTVQSLDAQSDDDRYRELYIYPSINSSRTTLHVDYIKKAVPLVNTTDEPIIPLNDRTVLLYGALALTWSRERNPAEADRNKEWYDEKLARMAGKLQDTFDKPRISVSKNYLAAKRYAGRSQSFNSRAGDSWGGGSGGSSSQSTGTASMAAQFGADGVLVASTTVSTTELGYLDGLTSSAVGTSQSQTLTNKTIDADSNIITNIANSGIKTGAAITRAKLATGTAYSILANTSAGVISENATLTANQVVISDANGQLTTTALVPAVLTSATLADNQAAAATAASWVIATYDTVILRYSLKRGSANKETGVIYLGTDGTSAFIAQADGNIGTLGVTFTADISAGSLRLRYTTTSTGTAVTMKYIMEQWLA